MLLDEDGHDITDINIGSDKSSVMVRKMIIDLANREYAPATGPA
jgi:hypothetical protein